MATRAEITNAKRTTELLVRAAGQSYEEWLYKAHLQYIQENEATIQKALEQLTKKYDNSKAANRTVGGGN